MAAITSSNILRFPSKPMIVEYLQLHPTTSEAGPPFSTDKKIIEAVANVFANTRISNDEVEKMTQLTLRALNLGLPDCVLIVMVLNLEDALIDCAKQRKIVFSKPS